MGNFQMSTVRLLGVVEIRDQEGQRLNGRAAAPLYCLPTSPSCACAALYTESSETSLQPVAAHEHARILFL